jgi:hypothetical protein
MPAPVDPNEFVGHGIEGIKIQTLRKSRRVCHPEKQNQFLGVEVLEWYHPTGMRRQEKNRKGAPPAEKATRH